MNELIQVVDALAPKELETVLEEVEKHSNFFQTTTVFSEGGTIINTNVRNNSKWCPAEGTIAADIIHEAMNRALVNYNHEILKVNEVLNSFPIPCAPNTATHREGIQILKYLPHEYYQWHYDQTFDKKDYEFNRTISVILYLQNAKSGGRTKFMHRGYKPKAGQALVFPSNWCFPHSSEEVSQGCKIVAVSWYYSDYVY